MQPQSQRNSDDPLIALVHPIIMDDLSKWSMQRSDVAQHIGVYKRENPDKSVPCALILAVVKLPISVAEASDLLHKPENRQKWDKNIDNFTDLGEDLVYFTTKPFGTWPLQVSGRALLDRRLFKTLPDGTYLCASQSVKSDKKPEVKGLVRAWNFSNGVAIIPDGKNACTVRMLGCSDARGWMPRKLSEVGIIDAMTKILYLLLEHATKMEEDRMLSSKDKAKSVAKAPK